jgi:hypothetical protein
VIRPSQIAQASKHHQGNRAQHEGSGKTHPLQILHTVGLAIRGLQQPPINGSRVRGTEFQHRAGLFVSLAQIRVIVAKAVLVESRRPVAHQRHEKKHHREHPRPDADRMPASRGRGGMAHGKGDGRFCECFPEGWFWTAHVGLKSPMDVAPHNDLSCALFEPDSMGSSGRNPRDRRGNYVKYLLTQAVKQRFLPPCFA